MRACHLFERRPAGNYPRSRRLLASLVIAALGCGDGQGGGSDPPPPPVLSVDAPGFGTVGNALVTEHPVAHGPARMFWVGFSRHDAWRALLADLAVLPPGQGLWIAGRVVRQPDESIGFHFDPATTTTAHGVGTRIATTLQALHEDDASDGIVRAIFARVNGVSPTENAPRCGNGQLDPDEQCEPGSFCRGGCNAEVRLCVDIGCGEDCTCPAPSCGDFTLDEGEECDPPQSSCPGGRSCAADCTCADPTCGDGTVNPGEDCDGHGYWGLGSACVDGRRCGADCRCPSEPRCGDGVVDAGEACDAYGCPGGTTCDESHCTCRAPVCGDGRIESFEQCDPANDERRATCVLCNGEGECATVGCRADCICDSPCGDRLPGGFDSCDDGNHRDGDGCSADCRAECGGEVCADGAECCDYVLGPCIPSGGTCPG